MSAAKSNHDASIQTLKPKSENTLIRREKMASLLQDPISERAWWHRQQTHRRDRALSLYINRLTASSAEVPMTLI
jgi:hypothetical protein